MVTRLCKQTSVCLATDQSHANQSVQLCSKAPQHMQRKAKTNMFMKSKHRKYTLFTLPTLKGETDASGSGACPASFQENTEIRGREKGESKCTVCHIASLNYWKSFVCCYSKRKGLSFTKHQAVSLGALMP